MNEDAEYVVYRVAGASAESGFLDMARAELWDKHVKRMAEDNRPLCLTLLARNLTRKQAKQFVELSKESTE